jgi:hypothetical protein
MLIHDVASKWQMTAIEFGQVNVAANQNAVALTVGGLASGAVGKTQVFDGQVVGLSLNLTAAASAGQLTAQVTVNGTVKATAQLVVTTAAKAYARIPRDAVRFVAGDVIGVKLTTNSGWNGTTSGLDVTVDLLSSLDGI